MSTPQTVLIPNDAAARRSAALSAREEQRSPPPWLARHEELEAAIHTGASLLALHEAGAWLALLEDAEWRVVAKLFPTRTIRAPDSERALLRERVEWDALARALLARRASFHALIASERLELVDALLPGDEAGGLALTHHGSVVGVGAASRRGERAWTYAPLQPRLLAQTMGYAEGRIQVASGQPIRVPPLTASAPWAIARDPLYRTRVDMLAHDLLPAPVPLADSLRHYDHLPELAQRAALTLALYASQPSQDTAGDPLDCLVASELVHEALGHAGLAGASPPGARLLAQSACWTIEIERDIERGRASSARVRICRRSVDGRTHPHVPWIPVDFGRQEPRSAAPLVLIDARDGCALAAPVLVVPYIEEVVCR